jgi:hypothetical protein
MSKFPKRNLTYIWTVDKYSKINEAMQISGQPPYRIFSSDFFTRELLSSMHWPEAHANGEGRQYVFFGSMEAVSIVCLL